MKQKLLIAALLLAGGILGAFQYQQWSADTDNVQDGSEYTNADLDNVAFGAGNEMVKRAARNLANSRPVIANGKFRISYFGVNLSGPAKLVLQGSPGARASSVVESGAGAFGVGETETNSADQFTSDIPEPNFSNPIGRSRSEFSFAVDNTRCQLIHISDGNYRFFLKQIGDEEVLEFVDRRQIGNDTPNSFSTLESGNLVAVVGQLATAFEFSAPREIGDGETAGFEMIGRWKSDYLERMLLSSYDPAEVSQWQANGLPEHIPDRVVLVLAKSQDFPLFPYRVEFQKTVGGVRKAASPTTVRMVASFEVLELQRAAAIPDDYFKVQPGVYQPHDRTAFYVNRIRELEESNSTILK